MSVLSRAISFFLVASAASVDPLCAQSAVSASAEIAVGGGKGFGGEYVDRGIPTARLAASIRLSRTPTASVFAELSADWLDRGHKLSCSLDSRLMCIPWYPGLTGVAATGGVIRRPNANTELRVAAGAGFYKANEEPRTATTAVIAQADAALFFSPHLGLTAGARAVVLPAFRGNLLAFIPVTVGARIR